MWETEFWPPGPSPSVVIPMNMLWPKKLAHVINQLMLKQGNYSGLSRQLNLIMSLQKLKNFLPVEDRKGSQRDAADKGSQRFKTQAGCDTYWWLKCRGGHMSKKPRPQCYNYKGLNSSNSKQLDSSPELSEENEVLSTA